MTNDDDEDLPYGENFHDESEAAAWANKALRKRPFRPMIFDYFVAEVMERAPNESRVLELGSGPGFLAEHVLSRCPSISHYTLLDFSMPMIQQSQQRLGAHSSRTTFVQANFKSPKWPTRVEGPFDFVFSSQAVHELRHKRHAPALYAQTCGLLSPGGAFVVCDHLPDSGPTPRHRRLYMSIQENLEALSDAGFSNPELLWTQHEMALYRAPAGPASTTS